MWIVGSATIADTVGKGSLATTLSMISVFFAAGVILGPMVAGALMHWFGYWVTWAVVLVVLGVDIFMRLVMIEDRDEGKKESVSNGRGEVGERGDEDAAVSIPVEEDETTSLLDDQRAGSGKNRQVATDTDTGGKEGRPAGNFYAIMLRRSRVLTALMAHLTNSIVLAGFDTTLPLHVKRVFGWNTLDAGLMFGLLQLPVMVLSPVTGRLKDKIGMCYPAAIGYLMMAPLLWLLGSPGDEGTAWLGSDQKGRTVYMVTIVCIGLGRSFTVGTASIELTRKFTSLSSSQLTGKTSPRRFRKISLGSLDPMEACQGCIH